MSAESKYSHLHQVERDDQDDHQQQNGLSDKEQPPSQKLSHSSMWSRSTEAHCGSPVEGKQKEERKGDQSSTRLQRLILQIL